MDDFLVMLSVLSQVLVNSFVQLINLRTLRYGLYLVCPAPPTPDNLLELKVLFEGQVRVR